MSTKTRSIVISALASLSVAAATVVPAASQAQAISPQAKAVACEILKSAGTVWQEAGEAAEAKGEADRAAYYFDMADKVAGEAGNLGCLWEIEIDATKVSGKVKGIKVPIATIPITTRTTSGSVAVALAK